MGILKLFIIAFPIVYLAELLLIHKLMEIGKKNMKDIQHGKAGKQRLIKVIKGNEYFILNGENYEKAN